MSTGALCPSGSWYTCHSNLVASRLIQLARSTVKCTPTIRHCAFVFARTLASSPGTCVAALCATVHCCCLTGCTCIRADCPLCAVQCVQCCHTLCVHAGAHGRPVQAHALQHSMQRDSSQGTARHVMQQMSLAMHRKDYDAAQQLFDLELIQQVQSYINGAFGDLHWVINSMSL